MDVEHPAYLAFASNCSQGAYSDGPNWQCKQNRPRRAVFITLISLIKFGAGEGIRTLDPNLGKVPERSTPWCPVLLHGTIRRY